MSALMESLAAAGFERLGRDHPQALNNMTTLVWGGCVRLVLRPVILSSSAGVVYEYMAEDNELTLFKILVEPSHRRCGLARSCLQALLKVVDQLDIELYLEPLPFEKPTCISKGELAGFYGELGFVAEDEFCKVMRRRKPVKNVKAA